MRLLLVEDDFDLCEVTAEYLRLLGYSVAQAHSVWEAVEFMRADSASVGLVITDYYLPDGNGLDVMREARTLGCADTPFFFISGQSELNPVELRGQGCREFFQKPLDMMKVSQAIERYLSVHPAFGLAPADVKDSSLSRL